jgi:hypothetical protein
VLKARTFTLARSLDSLNFSLNILALMFSE